MSSEHQEMGKSHIIHPLHHSHFLRSLELFLYIIIRKLHISTLFCCCFCSVAKLCLTLCYHMDCNLPGSSVHGILQARILEWVIISSASESSHSRIKPVSCVGRQILYHWATFSLLIDSCPPFSWSIICPITHSQEKTISSMKITDDLRTKSDYLNHF